MQEFLILVFLNYIKSIFKNRIFRKTYLAIEDKIIIYETIRLLESVKYPLFNYHHVGTESNYNGTFNFKNVNITFLL